MHIRHQLSFLRLSSYSAHSLAHRNPEAAMQSLVGSNDQHGPVPGAQLVESLSIRTILNKMAFATRLRDLPPLLHVQWLLF